LRQDSNFESARDELFAHIHRCGVLKATEGQQEWLEDTALYIAERYPMLSQEQLDELKMIGTRFCAPVIPHGKGNTALTVSEPAEHDEVAAHDERVEQDDEAETLTGVA
jgi:hypothetical protein